MFKRKRRVSEETYRVAVAAYEYVSEMDHPIKDFTMQRVTLETLKVAVSALPFDDRRMLSRGGGHR